MLVSEGNSAHANSQENIIEPFELFKEASD